MGQASMHFTVLLFATMCIGLVNGERRHYTSTDLRRLGKMCKAKSILPTADAVQEVEHCGIRKHRKFRGGRLCASTIIPVRITQRLQPMHPCHGTTNRLSTRIELSLTTTDKPHKAFQNFAMVNAQSVCNKFNRVNDLIVDQSIDILAITETWIKPHTDYVTDLIAPIGYVTHSQPRANEKGGGVAVVMRSALNAARQKTTVFSTFDVCTVVIPTKPVPTSLTVIYRPPSSPRNRFLGEFTDLLEQIQVNRELPIICGDFNIHMDDSSDAFAREFREVCDMFSLTQHVTVPTQRCGHTLDLILTRNSDDITSVPSLGTLFSDHHVIHSILNMPRKCFETVTKKTRPIKDIDRVSFKQDVKMACDNLLEQHDLCLEQTVSDFNAALKTSLDKHAPVVVKTTRMRQNNQWYDDDIRDARLKKRKLERRWKSSNHAYDLTIFFTTCSIQRKLITSTTLSNSTKETRNNYSEYSTLSATKSKRRHYLNMSQKKILQILLRISSITR